MTRSPEPTPEDGVHADAAPREDVQFVPPPPPPGLRSAAPAMPEPGEEPEPIRWGVPDDTPAPMRSDGFLEIAPPVLLEPLPAPVRAEALVAAAEPSPDEDPYAWASTAASSMEREGRVFDTGAFAAPPPPPPPPKVAGAVVPTTGVVAPPAQKVSVAPMATNDWPAPGDPKTAPAVREVLEPHDHVEQTGWRWAVAAIAFATAAIAAVGLVLALTMRPADDDALLQPVELAPQAPTPSSHSFALPEGEVASAPGDQVAFRGSEASGETIGPKGAGVVTIHSSPPGAVVRIGGRVRGRTPLELSLPAGDHEVELSLRGHAKRIRTIPVNRERVAFTTELVSLTARGAVQVVAPGWEGAILTVDGQRAGVLPTTVSLTPGGHAFVLDRGDRTKAIETWVDIEPRRTITLDLLAQ